MVECIGCKLILECIGCKLILKLKSSLYVSSHIRKNKGIKKSFSGRKLTFLFLCPLCVQHSQDQSKRTTV